MSKLLDKFKETRIKLDAISPSFCLAKWSMVTLHLERGETHSCYNPGTHKIPLEEIAKDVSALHNTSFKKQQRKLMLEGERPPECQHCWNMEDLGDAAISDRMRNSYRALEDFNRVVAASWSSNINPSMLEVSFNSNCQLKCLYCGPKFSTKWREEIKVHGGFGLHSGFNNKNEHYEDSSPYIEAFWKWWPELYPKLKVFRITGGEPLLSKETFRMLDYVIENPAANLDFYINSNLCVSDALMDQFIEKAKEISKKVGTFSVFGSVDTYGVQAAYIRSGFDYVQFIKNIRRILNEVPKSLVSFMITFNALSVPNYENLLNEILKLRHEFDSENNKRIFFDSAYLRHPEHLSVQILDESFDAYFDEQLLFMKANKASYGGFTQLEILKFEQVFKWKQKKPEAEKLKQLRMDFKIYINEIDRRRQTDFLKVFPEFKRFYNEVIPLA